MLLLREGQTDEAWKLSKKQFAFGNRVRLIETNYLYIRKSSLFVLRTIQNTHMKSGQNGEFMNDIPGAA
jgi:hypothetical protein